MPNLSITQRSVAAGLTLVAVILIVMTNGGALTVLLGGVALWLALRLSPYKVEVAAITDQPMSGGRIRWIFLIPGLVFLALGTEISADLLKTGNLPLLAPHIQFLALLIGLILFTMGMIGTRLSFPRWHIRWTVVLPVAVVIVLAFVVRAYKVGELVRLPVDEGHFMQGVFTLYPTDQTPTDLLTTVSGYLPATMIYSYFNYLSSLVWGANLVGLRMANVIIGTLTVLAVYGVGKVIFNHRVGLMAALVLATFPAHVFYSRVSMGQVSDTLFGLLAIFYAARGLRWNRRSDWVLMGVHLGLAQYFYEGGRFLYPAVFFLWIVLIGLLLRHKFRLLRRGLLLGVITCLVVIMPMYVAMWATQAPFTARLNGSGADSSLNQVVRALRGDLPADDVLHLNRVFSDAFSAYNYPLPSSMSDMYSGSEPMVLGIFVPLFLLGFFHALWRLRSALALILLVQLGTSFGNFLIGDPTVYGRYLEPMPGLALLIAIGIACTLPMLNPFANRFSAQVTVNLPSRRHWIINSVPLGVGFALFITFVQLIYFYGHLIPEFNYSARFSSPPGDIMDATLRFTERPNYPHEQMLIYDTAYGVPNGANDYLDYSRIPRDFLADVKLSTDISLETLDSLPRDHTYVFFVLPSDQRIIELLNESFTVEPPVYSPFSSPVVRTLYVMLVAPLELNSQPHHVESVSG